MKCIKVAELQNGSVLVISCRKCGHVFNQGSFILIVLEDDNPVGLVPDDDVDCCGGAVPVPRVYESNVVAMTSAQLLSTGRGNLEVLPFSILDEMLAG